MPTYSDLPGLMRTMTEAAIDAELREREWYGDAASGYRSDGYDGRLPPVSPHTGDVVIELVQTAGSTPSGGPLPPGAELVGDPIQVTGGLKYQYRVNAGEDIYGPWFDRINAAFERWRDLPDPASFDDGIAGVVDAVGQLTVQAGDARPGSDPVAEADLSTLLNNNLAAITPDQGAVALAFTSAYGAVRTTTVISGQRELLITLGVALAAEQRAWAETRRSVVAVAESATGAFARAGGDPIDFGAVKGFLEALAGILPAGKVVDALGKAVKASTFLQAVTPSRPTPPDPYHLAGGSPDAVYDHLIVALDRLDTDLTDAETGIRDLLGNALAKASAPHERSDYHISPDPGLDTRPDDATVGDTDWSAPGQIHVNVELYQSVGLRAMPGIAAYLESASDLAGRSGTPTPWLRAGAVGSGGQYGPFYNEYVDFLELVTSVLSSSAAEILAAGQKLAIAAGYIGDADQEARGAFDRKAAEITPDRPRGGPGADDPVSSDDLDDEPLGWPAEAEPRTPPAYDPNHPVGLHGVR